MIGKTGCGGSMGQLHIETLYDAFYPGTEAVVKAIWELPRKPKHLELRLVWNTSGKGDRDLVMVSAIQITDVEEFGSREITVQLPSGPYSFSGTLISVIWAFELVAIPDNESVRKEFVLGPNAQEVLVGAAAKSDS
ncbi:hypothetical protein [Planctomicrobium sp. SH527]|uniref:hypothetical protein n=1 Tax=Planctomicrobium sp. SH527 TaxID=3448123 RepID=UPI003F5AECC7